MTAKGTCVPFAHSIFLPPEKWCSDMIIKAVNSTASLFLLIVLGYLMGGSRVLRDHRGDLVLSYILANWALPAFIFYNIYTSFTGRDELLALVRNLPVPFLMIGIMLALGALFARIFKVSPSRRGAFMDGNAFANTSFIGFPIITSLFGSEALSVGMLYYIANTLLFFTVGTWLLSRDAGATESIFTKAGLKKIFSPMVGGLILGILARLLELPLPAFLKTSLSYFTSVCPCLGMFFVGMVIRRNTIRIDYFFPDMAVLLLLRYLVTPFVIGLFLTLLPLPLQVKAVFFILAMMPSITQMSIMGQVLGSDSTFCALWLTVSSLVGVAFVPVLVFLAESVFRFLA